MALTIRGRRTVNYVSGVGTVSSFVFIGDDITFGTGTSSHAVKCFPTLVDNAYGPTVSVTNLAVAGYLISDWLDSAKMDLVDAAYNAGYDRNVAVIMLGMTDIIAEASLIDIISDLTDLIDRVAAAGYDIVICLPPEAAHDVRTEFDDKYFVDFKNLSDWIILNQTFLNLLEVVPLYYDLGVGQSRSDNASNWQLPDAGGTADDAHLGDSGQIAIKNLVTPVIDRILANAPQQTLIAPQHLVATEGSNSIQLDWDTMTSVVFHVLRADTLTGSAVEIYAGTAHTYTDGTALNGHNYFYFVYGVLAGLNNSPMSIVNATAAASALTSPTSFAATPTSTQVSLSWGAVAGATSYKVYRGRWNTFADAIPIATVGITSYVDVHGDNVQTWHYWVVAKKDGINRKSGASHLQIN